MNQELPKKITVAITGASGAIYATRLIEELLKAGKQIDLLISDMGLDLLEAETNFDTSSKETVKEALIQGHNPTKLETYFQQDWHSPAASGSSAAKTMIITPCSMSTLAAIANGNSSNLIQRAADVVIKEQGKLILMPREMPFSAIHLENMLKLARLGCCIMPPTPGFYNNPESIDDLVNFIIARALDQLGIKNNLSSRWGCINQKAD
ncbi:MAG: UbiX family flavin prenyltransferase [Gammaproteobacteria bacterium]|nr:MAG: UbiX family flavin prenyltransferase [Gammaproteobacteria bacterium]